jgi:hypothetical protein
MTRLIDKMLSDETVRRKLIDWAVTYALARGTDPATAIHACVRVCAAWKVEITGEVMDQLEEQRRIDESCVF